MKSIPNEVARNLWIAFDATQSFFTSDQAYPYILGIIGLKSLSDRGGDDVVRWNEIASEHYDIDSVLNEALFRVEAAYPEYRGWFEDLDYNFKTFGDHQAWSRLWQPVVSAVSEIDFSRMLDEDPLALYHLCIKLHEFVSLNTGAKGVLETSESLAALMSVLLAPQDGQTVYDPFCRGGTTLISAMSRARDQNLGARLDLYAQSPYHEAARNTQLTMFAAGERYIHVAVGDVIRNPGFVDGRNVKTFDRILCTTPFGGKNWGEEIARYDPFGRFTYGIPPATQGDFAYLQHCIASLSDDGVLAAVVPPSLLFKERREGEIRRRIIEKDLIEAVIRLPPKILAQTGIPVVLLVIRRTKPEARRGNVLFIDASKGFLQGRSQNTLRDEDIVAIEKAYNAFDEIEGYSAVCSIKTIAEHGFNLDVSDYVVERPDFAVTLDLEDTVQKLDELHQRRTGQYDEMHATLARLMEHMEGE